MCRAVFRGGQGGGCLTCYKFRAEIYKITGHLNLDRDVKSHIISMYMYDV